MKRLFEDINQAPVAAPAGGLYDIESKKKKIEG